MEEKRRGRKKKTGRGGDRGRKKDREMGIQER